VSLETLILDYKEFHLQEKWKCTEVVSSTKGDYLFSAQEKGRHARHSLGNEKMKWWWQEKLFSCHFVSSTDITVNRALSSPAEVPREPGATV